MPADAADASPRVCLRAIERRPRSTLLMIFSDAAAAAAAAQRDAAPCVFERSARHFDVFFADECQLCCWPAADMPL